MTSEFVPNSGSATGNSWETYQVSGSSDEIQNALADAEVALRQAKEAYREDMSETNREEFHKARDVLQKLRKATRGQTMGVVADEVG